MLLEAKILKNWEKYDENRGNSKLWERGNLWVLRTMNKCEKFELSVHVNHKTGSSCIFASYLVILLLCHHLAFSKGGAQTLPSPVKLVSNYYNPQVETRVIPLYMQYQQPSQPSLYLDIEIIFQDSVSSLQIFTLVFLKSSFYLYYTWLLKSFQISVSLIALVHHVSQDLPLNCPYMFLTYMSNVPICFWPGRFSRCLKMKHM